jgi:hypothetical protein
MVEGCFSSTEEINKFKIYFYFTFLMIISVTHMNNGCFLDYFNDFNCIIVESTITELLIWKKWWWISGFIYFKHNFFVKTLMFVLYC